MMIITQKISLLAFSFNDGIRPPDKLIESQKEFAIKYVFIMEF